MCKNAHITLSALQNIYIILKNTCIVRYTPCIAMMPAVFLNISSTVD